MKVAELDSTYLSLFCAVRGVFRDIGQSNLSATQRGAKVARTGEASIIKGVCLRNRTSNTGAGQGIHKPSPGEDSKVGQLFRGKMDGRVAIDTVGDAKQAQFI